MIRPNGYPNLDAMSKFAEPRRLCTSWFAMSVAPDVSSLFVVPSAASSAYRAWPNPMAMIVSRMKKFTDSRLRCELSISDSNSQHAEDNDLQHSDSLIPLKDGEQADPDERRGT